MIIVCAVLTMHVYTVCMTQGGMTALMEAACRGHMETVRILLAAGADIDLQDKVSDNPDEIIEDY